MRTVAQLLLLLDGAWSAPVVAQHTAGGTNPSDDAVAATLRTQDFIHVPGPNPILTVGGNGTWDASVIECAGGVYAEYDSTSSIPCCCSTSCVCLYVSGPRRASWRP